MLITRFFAVRFVAVRPTAKVSEQTNRNMPARKALVHVLALYTNPESQNAQWYRQTDGRHDDANSRSYCVAVRSAKNGVCPANSAPRACVIFSQ